MQQVSWSVWSRGMHTSTDLGSQGLEGACWRGSAGRSVRVSGCCSAAALRPTMSRRSGAPLEEPAPVQAPHSALRQACLRGRPAALGRVQQGEWHWNCPRAALLLWWFLLEVVGWRWRLRWGPGLSAARGCPGTERCPSHAPASQQCHCIVGGSMAEGIMTAPRCNPLVVQVAST